MKILKIRFDCKKENLLEKINFLKIFFYLKFKLVFRKELKNKVIQLIYLRENIFISTDLIDTTLRFINQKPLTEQEFFYFDSIVYHDHVTISPIHRPIWSPTLHKNIWYVGDFLICISDSNKNVVYSDLTELKNSIKKFTKIEKQYFQIVNHNFLNKSFLDDENRHRITKKLSFLPIPKFSVIIPTTFINHSSNETLSIIELINDINEYLFKFNNIEYFEFIFSYGAESNLNNKNLLEDFLFSHKIPHNFLYDRSKFNFSKRINSCLEISKHQNILILNDDISIKNNLGLQEIMLELNSKDCASVSTILVNSKRLITHAGLNFNSNFFDEYLKGTHLKENNSGLAHSREVDGNTFGFIFIDKSRLKDIGMLNEFYELDFNDVEWCLRATRKGYRHVMVPSNNVFHEISTTRGEKTSGPLVAQQLIKAFNLNNTISNYEWNIPFCCYEGILKK